MAVREKPRQHHYDVFVSYASEDLETVARPIVAELWKIGIKQFWFDQTHIRFGDSIPRKIDEGLANALYYLPIISSAFLQKRWPRDEFDASSMSNHSILPVWVDLRSEQVGDYSPRLASIKALRWEDNPEEIAQHVAKVLMRDPQTEFHQDEGERIEVKAFWAHAIMYIMFQLDSASTSMKKTIAEQCSPVDQWLAHFEQKLGLSKQDIAHRASLLDCLQLSSIPQAQAIALLIKAKVKGWAPYFPGDEDLIQLLMNHGFWTRDSV